MTASDNDKFKKSKKNHKHDNIDRIGLTYFDKHIIVFLCNGS